MLHRGITRLVSIYKETFFSPLSIVEKEMAFLLSLLLGVYLAPLALSDLIINVQPQVISPVFTSQLVINCSVTNNQVPNIDVIKYVSLLRFNVTINDFYVLLSLDIQTFNLQRFVQFRHAQVSFGNLFLSLTVYNPVQSDAQAYRCNIDGDNSVQKNASMKGKKEVKYEPNVTALIQEITRLKISEDIEKCSSKNVRHLRYNNISKIKLNFVGSSEIVKELIEPLTVKCSFLASNDSPYQDSVLQFMYILHETNDVIATISSDQPVTKSGQNLSSYIIQGELYHNLSKDSYLQVTWQNVKLSDSGKYFCGAHVNNLFGQKDRIQVELVISVQRPTLDDLVKVVHDLQREVGKTNYTSLLQEFQKILIPESCRGIIYKKERVEVTLASGLEVMCDTKTDGGGWIIFQRRINGKVDFYRGWQEYRDGFGDYNIGEFYLGNENIFKLTSTGQFDLRIDLEFNNTKYFAQYKDFKVLSETEKYKLMIGDYSGSAGDDLSKGNNMFFSTFDRENDGDPNLNCAEYRSGA
ncbi:BpFREP21.2 [Biomphalaria pfeifferi]|uniref:BpFREP21.2 n=1 Tax=Biomphalaria pfeifferi TaxID=112525 RepID=A0AAD8C4B3_BIOPF|nr:BpFREP21.2 [Biomphalaria pfeifferi]